jgi:hypothetical protein
MDAELLAYKVLLWQGRSNETRFTDGRPLPIGTTELKSYTTGGLKEAVEIKAKEYRVTNRKVIDKATEIVLARLNVIR